jgi:cytochrome oxidase Cu insertion factor (SCO1/SenC/PrrC family)
LPHLQEIYHKYRDQGFRMVAINIIPEQDRMIPEWIERGNYTFPVLVGVEGADEWRGFTESLFADYEMFAAPTTFLLDGQGRILARYDGYQDGGEEEIERDVRRFLPPSH